MGGAIHGQDLCSPEWRAFAVVEGQPVLGGDLVYVPGQTEEGGRPVTAAGETHVFGIHGRSSVARSRGGAGPTAAHLAEYRRDGQRWVYRLNPEPLIAADAWMRQNIAAWERRFQALGGHLDGMAAAERADEEGDVP